MTNSLAALAAATLLSFAAIAPVYAQSIPQEEIDQLSNAAAPDVDPGASRGVDKPIVTQEKMQLGNFTGPSVPERSEKGGESIPKMEQEGLE